ncbi:translocation and assembly module TamA [Oryzomicrobium terrae]|uniref:Translocation and assembly module TamA n=2 Tax=Oryzomicrobium terrae TaxID=1735038 RepID=A0A5C1E8F9_9RHOO|nr:translocation and assembly module TamA [Oryzomicrobium terrae]
MKAGLRAMTPMTAFPPRPRPTFHRLALAGVLGLLLGLPAGAFAAAYTLRLQGGDATAEAVLRPLLDKYFDPELPAQSYDGERRDLLLREARRRLPELLATEGYFSPLLQADAPSDDAPPILVVDPGPRTTVGQVVIDFAEAAALPPERQAALRQGWKLPAGQPFRAGDWESAKSALLTALLTEDFAGAQLRDSRAEVDPDTATARLTVTLVPGPRYVLGPLQIVGLERYDDALIDRYNRTVRPGRPYRESDLIALQTALQSTPYFSSANVELLPREGDSGDGETVTAPVRLTVREKAAHRIGTGAGFSSNTGARVELSYRSADLFSRAWELSSGVRLEQKRQTGYADIFLPPDANGARNSVGGSYDASDIQGMKLTRSALGVVRSQQRGSIEMRLSVNYQVEQREIHGEPTTRLQALTPNVQYIWRAVDNLLDPRSGIVAQAQAGGAAKGLLADQNFLRLQGRATTYFPVGQRDVLSLRGELGATLAPSRDGIPQDYLFRSGGTGSVRGYTYQSLGVKEGNAVVGGRYLAVLSGEYTHWIDKSPWGIAAFVDAGNASDDPAKWSSLAVGYGLGVRWKSPAGPLAVDLAYGQKTGDVQLHFSVAIPF